MQTQPTVSIILDTRREKKTGKFPVKLRVTLIKKQNYYQLGFDLTKEQFDLMLNPNHFNSHPDPKEKKAIKELKLKCDIAIVKANEIIKSLPEFTFSKFENKLYNKTKSNKDLIDYYHDVIVQLNAESRLGTADNYACSLSSLKSFQTNLAFSDITPNFLKSYEKWFLAKGRSITTVGIYLRPLRAILNHAISDGIVLKENYPFEKRKYQIPSSRNIKKALTIEEIGKIYKFQAPAGSWLEKAHDFFFISYLGNGINIKDIALLKHHDIDGNFIRFNRAKTMTTNRSCNMKVSIFLSEELKSLIEKWQNIVSKEPNYLFSIVSADMDPKKMQAAIKQFTKMLNNYLRIIAKEVGIPKNVTTYFARHSFATILRRSGKSTEFISECLGHSNIMTTTSYLDSFEDHEKANVVSVLTDFNNEK